MHVSGWAGIRQRSFTRTRETKKWRGAISVKGQAEEEGEAQHAGKKPETMELIVAHRLPLFPIQPRKVSHLVFYFDAVSVPKHHSVMRLHLLLLFIWALTNKKVQICPWSTGALYLITGCFCLVPLSGFPRRKTTEYCPLILRIVVTMKYE